MVISRFHPLLRAIHYRVTSSQVPNHEFGMGILGLSFCQTIPAIRRPETRQPFVLRQRPCGDFGPLFSTSPALWLQKDKEIKSAPSRLGTAGQSTLTCC